MRRSAGESAQAPQEPAWWYTNYRGYLSRATFIPARVQYGSVLSWQQFQLMGQDRPFLFQSEQNSVKRSSKISDAECLLSVAARQAGRPCCFLQDGPSSSWSLHPNFSLR